MPLSKKKDRARKKKSNSARLENLVIPINSNPNRLESSLVQPNTYLDVFDGDKQHTLNQLRDLVQSKSRPLKVESNSKVRPFRPAPKPKG